MEATTSRSREHVEVCGYCKFHEYVDGWFCMNPFSPYEGTPTRRFDTCEYFCEFDKPWKKKKKKR